MKELFSAFGKDVLRPIATLLLPGLLALAPYILLTLYANPTVRAMAKENQLVAASIITPLALFLGMLFEEFGAHMEKGWDQLCDDQHLADWKAYLLTMPDKEPLAFRYIKTLVMRLKFTLGAYTAILIAIPGAAAATAQLSTRAFAWLIAAGLLGIAAFLRIEATYLHQALAESRRWITQANLAPTAAAAPPPAAACRCHTRAFRRTVLLAFFALALAFGVFDSPLTWLAGAMSDSSLAYFLTRTRPALLIVIASGSAVLGLHAVDWWRFCRRFQSRPAGLRANVWRLMGSMKP